MPTFHDIRNALQLYEGRYEFLDAFVDDIEEVQSGALAGTPVVQPGVAPLLRASVDGSPLFVRLFPHQGIARFSLSLPPGQPGGDAAAGAFLGGLVGTAVGAASKSKEGLLGGLVLGMLVGGIAGAAAAPAPLERVLALQFDPHGARWQLYDGPLLRWAKQTLQPAR